MRREIITVALVVCSCLASAQKSVTLWECYDSAATASPLAGERALYTEMSSLRERNLATGYMPSLDLNGSFVYNSDVVDMSDMLGSLPIPPGSLPSVPHEQYRATLDINQVIWDGGVTRSARAVEQVIRDLNLQQNEADIYRLREQVNNLFFSVLLASSQSEVVALLINDIDARIKETRSGVDNGVLPPVSLDVLNAERIRAGQSLIELNLRKTALIDALENITGMNDLRDAVFVLPDVVVADASPEDNPDLKIFDIRERQLEVPESLLKSQRMPKAFAFAQAGYGNPPGSNFLADKADVYYSLGAGIKWNIFDWNKNSNERKSLAIQQQLLDIRKSSTEEALNRMLVIKKAEIASLEEASRSDAGLIAIRKRIAATAASQLENGTLTASQYMTELNNEKQAVIAASVRLINLARAKVDYMNITGKNK